MKTAILYATSHGAAKEAAEFLAKRIENAELINVKQNPQVDLAPYDTVIVGGSIYMGSIQRAVKKLLKNQDEILRTKKIGLYLCCMYEADVAKQQFNDAYPPALREHATACGLFGGKFDFDQMNFLEKGIVKKVVGVTHSVNKMNKDAMKTFATQIKG